MPVPGNMMDPTIVTRSFTFARSNWEKNIIDKTDIPLIPETFVHKSRTGHIYAKRITDQLFDKKRSVQVYTL